MCFEYKPPAKEVIWCGCSGLLWCFRVKPRAGSEAEGEGAAWEEEGTALGHGPFLIVTEAWCSSRKRLLVFLLVVVGSCVLRTNEKLTILRYGVFFSSVE